MDWEIQDYEARRLLDELTSLYQKLGQVARRLRRSSEKDNVYQADCLEEFLDELGNAAICAGLLNDDD